MANRRGVALGASIAGVGYAAWLLGDWGSDSLSRTAGDVGLVGFAVFATVCTALAARQRRGRERAAWFSMAVGTAGWAVGGAGWSVFRLAVDPTPLPWWANACYLLFLVGTALCLVLLLTAHARGARLRLLLDGLIVAAALFVLSWVAVLDEVYQARTADRVSTALSLVYPVGDILLIALAVLLLVRAPAPNRPELSLLTGGLALIAASDSAFAYFAAAGDLDGHQQGAVGWALGFAGIGLAALFIPGADQPRGDATDRVPSRVSVWLPYIPVLASTVLCTPMLIDGLGPAFVAAAVAVFAVMIRQLLVIGENRRLLIEVSDHALRDPLTGLASRALFIDRLTHAVALHQRHSLAVAVLLVDLDQFKLINDSFGHPAGDTTLVRVGERLAGTVRGGDTVARLGGDEFAVLMEGNADSCRAAAQRVVQAFERPFLVDGQELVLRPSVGLALAGTDDVDVSADELLRQADIAMNAAKCSGAGPLCTFSAEVGRTPCCEADPRRIAMPDAAQLLSELRHAIEHFELTVFYQPKFDMRRDELVGLEALIRWPHPERGLLAPHQFLPLVRQHGLMRSMTTVVLELALDDAAQWSRQGIAVPVAVNVFAPAVGDPSLPGHIMGALQSRELSPQVLTVEITEDLLLDNIGQARSVFDMLRRNGIRVAIDDFGSGYSALWYLREFPVDEIKLDKEFVAPVLTHPASAAIVRSVIGLAHDLGITPVAEGVENAETAQQLLEFGCEVGQGFHYSRPLPAVELTGLLAARTRHNAAGDYFAAGTRRSDIELMQ